MEKVHDDHIADDLLQESFIRIHSRIGTLKDKNQGTGLDLPDRA